MNPLIWLKVAVGAGLALVLLWALHTIYQLGWDSRDADWKADTAKREEYGRAEKARLQLAYDQIVIGEAVIQAQKQRKRDVEYREVIKQRTVYRETHNAGACAITTDFVCHVDGAFAEDSGLPEASPSTCRDAVTTGTLSDIELLSYITDAKKVCFDWRDEVIFWREYYSKLQTIR
jgi:hypothetical protein